MSPTNGVLEPFGREGTPIIVSFTPVEYGAPKRGKLIVKTEDMMWSYRVIGRHPTYKAPEAQGGRIDNRLSQELHGTISRRNYIRDNIKNLSPRRSEIRSRATMSREK